MNFLPRKHQTHDMPITVRTQAVLVKTLACRCGAMGSGLLKSLRLNFSVAVHSFIQQAYSTLGAYSTKS